MKVWHTFLNSNEYGLSKLREHHSILLTICEAILNEFLHALLNIVKINKQEKYLDYQLMKKLK
jgi:hypothetical protein